MRYQHEPPPAAGAHDGGGTGVTSRPAGAQAPTWDTSTLYLPDSRAAGRSARICLITMPMRAGSGQVPGLIMDWTRVPCLTWAAYCWPRRPNWSMAVATRWMLAWTTGPSG